MKCSWSAIFNTSYDQNSVLVTETLCYLGIIFLSIFGIKSLFTGSEVYGVALLGFGLSIALSLAYYKASGSDLIHKSFLTLSFTLLYLYLLATGGQENTGLLWCYAYPLLIFTFVGLKRGLAYLIFIVICSVIILYVPDHPLVTHSYSDNTRSRFVGSMFFISLMSYLLELERERANAGMAKANATLEAYAVTDELTGLYNRRGINQKINYELQRSRREGSEVTVILCDVDFFKQINDQHGHDVGDAALKLLATQFTNTLRATDYAGRWGGEEFALVLPNTPVQEGFMLAERIRKRIAACSLVHQDLNISLSISSGISSSRYFDQYDELIKAIDISLYSAKKSGRNRTEPQAFGDPLLAG